MEKILFPNISELAIVWRYLRKNSLRSYHRTTGEIVVQPYTTTTHHRSELTLREVTFARLVLGENSRALCDECMYLDMFGYVTQLRQRLGLVGRTRDMITERIEVRRP